jgi:WhiB family redox-sensing transcriptional regulator
MTETFATHDRDQWRLDADCRDLDTATFFPETADAVAVAIAICAGCPVRDACREFALVTRQDDGIWGGLDENERRRARRRRQDAARRAA